MVYKIFKSCDLKSISIKLGVLYFLNTIDLFITDFLLGTEMFVEANKLMNYVISNTYICILVKLIVPFTLLLILQHRLKGASSSQISKGNTVINIGVLFYLIVNISHLIWIFIYYTVM